MRIQVNKREFAGAVADVVPFSPAKPMVSIFEYIKITTKGQRMKVEAGNDEASMTRYIDVIDSEEDGQFLVNAKDLNKFISKESSEVIELRCSDSVLTIKYSNGQVDLPLLSADDYPELNIQGQETTEIRISANILGSSIATAKNFISTDTLRPVLCGIYAYVKSGEFGFCGTDTHKLIHGHKKVSVDDSVDAQWLIMPTCFSALQKKCSASVDDVLIKITDKAVSYKIGDAIIRTVMSNGTFPNFMKAIPTQSKMELSVNKNELLDSIGRVSLFSDQASNCIKCQIDGDIMKLSADNIAEGKKAMENIPIKGCDSAMAIGLSSVHLEACVKAFSGNELNIKFLSPAHPALFTSEDVVAVLMPMLLQND